MNVRSLVDQYRYHRWDAFLPMSKDEKVIAYSISFTFLFYLIGALYLVAPIIGWSLLIAIGLRWSSGQRLSFKNTKWLIFLWFLSAILLEVALILGHIDFNLGFGKIIKSTIGWAKGWALLSIFIILGYTLDIRYQVVCRAACIVGLAALIITPVLVFAYIASLPQTVFVSPLKVLGGSGPEYFTIQLYEIDPFNGRPRWRFFRPMGSCGWICRKSIPSLRMVRKRHQMASRWDSRKCHHDFFSCLTHGTNRFVDGTNCRVGSFEIDPLMGNRSCGNRPTSTRCLL